MKPTVLATILSSVLLFALASTVVLAVAQPAAGAQPAASAGAAAAPRSQPCLLAGVWDSIDAVFMRYREWILTLGLVVVILGFALLYKSWK